jgi:RNA polymerase sigma-70 factor (ECF subfamily)
MASAKGDVTELLLAWSNGDRQALDKLIPMVYDELHRMAKRCLHRERADHTLQATALVNEAYLRLIDQNKVTWQNRAHFFAIAAQIMRRILVDYARGHRATKRGGSLQKLSLDEAIALPGQEDIDLELVDDALNKLAELDPRQSQIVELRFFGGLSIEETAQVLGISPATVKREWGMAKAWLYRQLSKR